MPNQDELIENLFLSYHDALKKACMGYFHYLPQYMPYVDDCVQEVFVAAIKKQDDLAQHPNPYAWLSNACRKQCVFFIRQRVSRQNIIGKQIPFCDAMPESCVQDDIVRWLDAYDAERHLTRLREQLTEAEQLVFEEHFLWRKTAATIAEEQNTSETAVYGTIQRIRKKACRLMAIAIFFLSFFRG